MSSARIRRQRSRIGFVSVLLLVLTAGTVMDVRAELPVRYEIADLKALERAFVKLADQVRPSVVAIKTHQVPSHRRSVGNYVTVPLSQGSGFIIDPEGYIVTNRHVIEGADVISVILSSGIKQNATLVQDDRRSDLAILKIDATGLNLRAVELGDASKLRINQWVFASGNPFGLANEDGRISVTYGVVSALSRYMTDRLASDRDRQYYGDMIETSAAINPGGSGGPLFDIDGRVIGVVTAIETSSGVSEGHGFAIPVNRNTRRIMETMKKGETVRYGFIGVMVADVDPPRSSLIVNSRAYRGASLDRISLSDGPAARAGLKPKDIVIEYDGSPIENRDHLVRLVGFTPVGAKVSVTYLRKGVRRTTTITVSDRNRGLSLAEQRRHSRNGE